jgi:hypothetical protein
MTSSPYSAEDRDVDTKDIDEPKHLEVTAVGAHGITWTPEEEKKLVRKIDLLLLPTIWLMYLLSYMDRTK